MIKEEHNCKQLVKEEEDVLSLSVINFIMAYDAQEHHELMITCQDILVKLLNYLEFWKQKSGKMKIASLIVDLIGRILKSYQTLDERVALQNMLNSFKTPKILIGMFNSEEKNDSESLLPKI